MQNSVTIPCALSSFCKSKSLQANIAGMTYFTLSHLRVFSQEVHASSLHGRNPIVSGLLDSYGGRGRHSCVFSMRTPSREPMTKGEEEEEELTRVEFRIHSSPSSVS